MSVTGHWRILSYCNRVWTKTMQKLYLYPFCRIRIQSKMLSYLLVTLYVNIQLCCALIFGNKCNLYIYLTPILSYHIAIVTWRESRRPPPAWRSPGWQGSSGQAPDCQALCPDNNNNPVNLVSFQQQGVYKFLFAWTIQSSNGLLATLCLWQIFIVRKEYFKNSNAIFIF